MPEQPIQSNLLGSGDQPAPVPSVQESNDFFDSQIFRFITLMLYMGGVSSLGFTLSLYYLIFWESAMPELPQYKTAHHPM